MINDFSDDDRTRRRLTRREPLPEGLYDFDGNGPVLSDEDEAILDKVWAQIAAQRLQKADDD